MSGGVVCGVVGPAAPDDAAPGSGEDANGVWVPRAAVAGALVDVGGPGAGLAAVGGEVDERFAELLVAAVAEGDVVFLAAGAGGGRDPGGRGECGVVREAGAAVADLGQQQGGAVGAGAGQAGEDGGVVMQGEGLRDGLVEDVDARPQVDQ